MSTNRAPRFQAVWVKKKKNQRACVLSAVAPASEEGSQRTRNPGKLDGSQETPRKLEPGQSRASGRRLSASRNAHGHGWAPRSGPGRRRRGERKARLKALRAVSHKVAPGPHPAPAGGPAGLVGGSGHPRSRARTPRSARFGRCSQLGGCSLGGSLAAWPPAVGLGRDCPPGSR